MEFSKEAFKVYKKFDASTKRRIDKVLLMLVEGEQIDLKPVQGTDDTFRVRVGSFRILIKKFKEDKVYLVVKMGSRGDVYKGM
ncbi:MAG: type II toxin-antitoxin system RelE/ParE family toxin [bacterium]|nr:type II toxin-antitoxin system RelE/ParE family toxin [bacterium]